MTQDRFWSFLPNKTYAIESIVSTRGRHRDPENRDFGIGIPKKGVGTGSGWENSIPKFRGGIGMKK